MTAMMKQFFMALAVTAMLAVGVATANAQIVPQVSNPVPPVPQPPPPPPPSLAVPQVPKMDAPPSPAPAPRTDRRSFNKRFNACQSDATATRLDPSDRAAYARACANQS